MLEDRVWPKFMSSVGVDRTVPGILFVALLGPPPPFPVFKFYFQDGFRCAYNFNCVFQLNYEVEVTKFAVYILAAGEVKHLCLL